MKTTAPKTDTAVGAYVKLIRTAEAVHAQVSRGLTAEGLTPSQFSTLKVLRLRGALAQKDIASHLLKTGGNITIVVDNLEKVGLVSRTRLKPDRRMVLVELTPAGIELFDRVYPPHLARIHGAMKTLDATEQEALSTILEKLHTTLIEPICVPVAEVQELSA